MKVEKVEKNEGVEPVYNMYVEDDHSFVLRDGIITHNCDALIMLLHEKHYKRKNQMTKHL